MTPPLDLKDGIFMSYTHADNQLLKYCESLNSENYFVTDILRLLNTSI
jgi:hypothetical protein